jgi:endonuclease YncB( thermonuclease family)
MKKIKLFFTSLICLSLISLSSCDTSNNLLISEVYESEGNDRALELYNNSDKDISLSGYSVQIYKGLSKDYSYKINLKGNLGPKETFVITHPLAKEETKKFSTLVTEDLNFNGSQAITLNKKNRIVDQIGVVGYSVKYYENLTLVRKSNYLFPNNTFDEYEWIRYANGNRNYLGDATNSVTPEELLDGPRLTDEDYLKPFFANEEKTLGGGGVVDVTVYSYVDGDTTMFNYPSELGIPNGTKVRYQNVDTRESYTGHIQEWGIPAKNYTKSCLMNADKIELQSVEGGTIYETFDRVLGWVWVDGVLQNYRLALNGYTEDAFSSIDTVTYKDIPYTSYIYNAKLYAMKMKKGIWGEKDPYWDYENNKSIYA